MNEIGIGSILTEKAVKLLVLDLDGTVRHGFDELGRFVNGPDDVIIFPEAVEQMKKWKDKGGRIIAISNQGGIALGYLTLEICLETMKKTDTLTHFLFDEIVICRHHPHAVDPEYANCWCRKPSPGMLIEAAIKLAGIYNEYYPPYMGLFVGDRKEDQECAKLAGFPFMWANEWREAGR